MSTDIWQFFNPPFTIRHEKDYEKPREPLGSVVAILAGRITENDRKKTREFITSQCKKQKVGPMKEISVELNKKEISRLDKLRKYRDKLKEIDKYFDRASREQKIVLRQGMRRLIKKITDLRG